MVRYPVGVYIVYINACPLCLLHVTFSVKRSVRRHKDDHAMAMLLSIFGQLFCEKRDIGYTLDPDQSLNQQRVAFSDSEL